ncbi:amidohydrolase family protein [Parapedobacter sp. 10938]|uniref:amidohydrolase family protein n=1 Tax=Parapedobacter flavus TaxID=3110225 RepID=UPI002DBBBBB9|nr:amidohydrolase family protein [Parapedobacter sp. 10938]MEC3879975.1 amidohydrolase family protein [Parapedobacter sp. 10938]
MNTFLSATYVLPVAGRAIKDGIVEVADDGTIHGVYPSNSDVVSGKPIRHHVGIITPGFVNTHCHLELSHMKGIIPKRTGLVPFLQQVMAQRAVGEAEIVRAMKAADKQLYDNGVVAVGDHANTGVSAKVKKSSRLYYHTFVEVIGFEPETAANKLADASAVASQFDKSATSITAHAPYSVSKELFKRIDDEARKRGMPLSIHNQESEAENRLFRYKEGPFLDFYNDLGKDITSFKAQARNSLHTVMPYLSADTPVLLVHNTFTAAKDIFFIERQGRNVTWCFCPNANLYIEGRLPGVQHFVQYGHPITVGTDSLASNDRLCVLTELKTIHQHFPRFPLTETIQWATINGARFLGIADWAGSLERGKTPGINLLTHTRGLALTPDTEVVRLV